MDCKPACQRPQSVPKRLEGVNRYQHTNQATIALTGGNALKLTLSIVIALLVCCAATASAQTDNLGRPIPGEAFTYDPAAESEVVELEVIPETPKHYFDLGITIGAAGSNDDDAASEMAIAEIALLYMPPTESGWIKLGVAMGWNQSDRTKIDFSTPVYFTIFPNPLSSVRYGFRVRPFTFTVRTSPEEETTSSFSFDPGGAFVAEFPMGAYSIAANVGAQYVFSQEGQTVNSPSLGAGVTLFFRLGR